jgi:hypothetical protein
MLRRHSQPACAPTASAPPTLAKGADDVFWVHQLHEALAAHGFYPDDEEAADWFFGDHTANALSMFQARAACAAGGSPRAVGAPSPMAAKRCSSASAPIVSFHRFSLRRADGNLGARRSGACPRPACATRRPGARCWAAGSSRSSSRRLSRCSQAS